MTRTGEESDEEEEGTESRTRNETNGIDERKGKEKNGLVLPLTGKGEPAIRPPYHSGCPPSLLRHARKMKHGWHQLGCSTARWHGATGWKPGTQQMGGIISLPMLVFGSQPITRRQYHHGQGKRQPCPHQDPTVDINNHSSFEACRRLDQ